MDAEDPECHARDEARSIADGTRWWGSGLSVAVGRCYRCGDTAEGAIDDGAVDLDGFGNVLDRAFTNELEPERHFLGDLFVDRLRDADAADFSERLQPRSDIDAVTHDVVAIDNNASEIDAGAELQPASGGKPLLRFFSAGCEADANSIARMALENSISNESPAVPTSRPWCVLIRSLRRARWPLRTSSVPISSSTICAV